MAAAVSLFRNNQNNNAPGGGARVFSHSAFIISSASGQCWCKDSHPPNKKWPAVVVVGFLVTLTICRPFHL